MQGAEETEENRFSVTIREVTFRSPGPLGRKIDHFAHEFAFWKYSGEEEGEDVH